ncbi:M48 family metallopeptidase [Halomonas sp. ML-15]|nr:M48 family metallopeptidase [Halomonas sp. ML-15]
MDFFAAQDRARRNTGRLVLLLIVAVVSLVAIATLAVALVLVISEGSQQQATGDPLARALDPYLLGTVALGVLALVVMGSLFKHLQLRAGGRAVAEAMGGRLLNGNARDADEQRMLNVVEEMAIASGTPVPAVYLLDEPAINAFAAGHSPQDAVIGVTRGAIERLDRDELQGVVAHEFSHIFNGDMRLNLRLVALLHGLLLIGLIGHIVLRGSAGRRLAGGNRNNNGQAAMLALGAALMVVGYVGTLCGNLVKAAVSRQREFLADASAVQFTRDPNGIGGALKKIGAHQHGSQLEASNAAEFSHLYFSRGIKAASGMLATHPPLDERIRRVDPKWDGELPSTAERRDSSDEAPAESAPAGESRGRDARKLMALALATIGQLDQAHLNDARRRLDALDPQLLEAAHDPCAARAVAYGVLIHLDPETRTAQRELLEGVADPAVLRELDALDAPLAALPADQRLVLIELAIPLLKQLSTAQYATFKLCLERLIAAESAPGALHWALYRVLVQGVEGRHTRRRDRPLSALAEPAAALLSSMARAGTDDAKEARRAFAAGVATLAPMALDYVPGPTPFSELDLSLDRLQRLNGDGRRQLLAALAECVEHDGRVSPGEAELFRALAEALDCPLPPLLDAGETN